MGYLYLSTHAQTGGQPGNITPPVPTIVLAEASQKFSDYLFISRRLFIYFLLFLGENPISRREIGREKDTGAWSVELQGFE